MTNLMASITAFLSLLFISPWHQTRGSCVKFIRNVFELVHNTVCIFLLIYFYFFQLKLGLYFVICVCLFCRFYFLRDIVILYLVNLKVLFMVFQCNESVTCAVNFDSVDDACFSCLFNSFFVYICCCVFIC